VPRPRTTGRKSTDARQVLVRLSAEEYAAVVLAADGTPLGMWVRSVALAAADKTPKAPPAR
jgi:hypothetical protein